MKIIANKLLKGTSGREFGFDLYLPSLKKDSEKNPIVVFVHGFKGFKDWGHWHRLAEGFAAAGYAFLKFNFSHNGVTIEHPSDFADLEAFGQNNFSKELSDVQTVLDWLSANAEEYDLNMDALTLIGHSRGGPIVLLTAARDARVHSVITWASVQALDYAWRDVAQVQAWKEAGVIYSPNARTGQQMPLYYQLYEDFLTNAASYSLENALKGFSKPTLIVHGTADPAVKVSAAEALKKLLPQAGLVLIEGADHVFGGRHPFAKEEPLPEHSKQLLEACLDFLDKNRLL